MSSRYGGYVDPVYLDASARVLEHLKTSSFDALSLAPGARVLDVGCGAGVDTVELARVVSDDGLVVGVDLDLEMVSEARRRDEEGPGGRTAVHLCSDGFSLPFRDSSFSAVRSERLLQHVHHPALIVGEMARVLRPGGQIVLVDTDWATLSIDASDHDVERRLVRYKTERLTRNGTSGRQLYRLLLSAGLVQVNVVPFPLTATFELFRIVAMWDALLVAAVRDQAITPAEAAAIEDDLVSRDQLGYSFGSLNLNLAVGRKVGCHDSGGLQA